MAEALLSATDVTVYSRQKKARPSTCIVDVFQVHILVVVKSTVIEVLLVKFFANARLLSGIHLSPNTSQISLPSSLGNFPSSLWAKWNCFLPCDSKDFIDSIRAGNRIHCSGIIPSRLSRTYLERLSPSTISRIGRNERIVVPQIVPVILETLESGGIPFPTLRSSSRDIKIPVHLTPYFSPFVGMSRR